MTRSRLALRRSGALAVSVAVATGLGLATAPAAHAAPTPGLSASGTCIFKNADGSFTAMFGYTNSSAATYTVPAGSAADPYNIAGYGLDVPSATVVGGQQTVFPAHSSGQSALRVSVPAGKTGGWILGDNSTPVTLDGNARVCGATDVTVQNWQGELTFGALLVPIAAVLLGRRRRLRRRALRNHPHAA